MYIMWRSRAGRAPSESMFELKMVSYVDCVVVIVK